MIKQAVILAGGQGTRLRPLTLTTPKPLIKIHGKPFLEYIIENLKDNGIKEVIILTGYLGNKIENYFKDGEKFGVKIKYSLSPVETETGSRIKNALPLIQDTFLLLYCDNYWPLNLKTHETFYKKSGKKMLVTVYENTDNYTKNNIYVNDYGIVETYDKLQKAHNLNGVDIGYFVINKSVLNNLPNENFSFEKFIFPKLIKEKQLAGFLTKHKYYGLSNLERIPEIKKFLKPKKIVLLDRDGVINKRPKKANYVKSVNEFILLPKAIEALKVLTKKKYQIYLISNQAGIARKLMSEKNLIEIHKYFLKICRENDIKISGIYYCPHGWDENCACRKPKPGMLFQAAKEHYFDLTKTIFIGDDQRDMETGKAANSKTILVTKNNSLYNIAVKLR